MWYMSTLDHWDGALRGCLSLPLIKLPHFCVKIEIANDAASWGVAGCAKASERLDSVCLETHQLSFSGDHRVSRHCCIFSTKDSRCKPKYSMFNKPCIQFSGKVYCPTVCFNCLIVDPFTPWEALVLWQTPLWEDTRALHEQKATWLHLVSGELLTFICFQLDIFLHNISYLQPVSDLWVPTLNVSKSRSFWCRAH